MNPAVRLAEFCFAFARVERATHHPDGVRPETNADHTVMLAAFACAVAERLNDNRTCNLFDVGLVAQLALVHDFPERYAGDTNTLLAFDAAEKRAREAVATQRILAEFSDYPWIGEMLTAYGYQHEREARLVRYLDKVVVKLAHTLNGGASLRKLGVGLEALKERHRLQIDELARDYPELTAELGPMLREMCDAAEAAYAVALAVPEAPVPRAPEPLAVTYARVLREFAAHAPGEVVVRRPDGTAITHAALADMLDAHDPDAHAFLDDIAACGVRAMGLRTQARVGH